MLDRLLFWMVTLTPALIVLVVVLSKRWKVVKSAQRTREMVLAAAIFFGGALMLLAWDLAQTQSGDTTRIHFRNPEYLWAVFPLYLALVWVQRKSISGLSGGRAWFSFLLRAYMLALLALALAGLQMVISRDLLTVIFALDRSKSVPNSEARRALELIGNVQGDKRSNDRIGLVLFGGEAAAEIFPTETFSPPKLAELKAEIGPNATDLGAAIRRARDTFVEGTARRLVLFTDGYQTQGDAIEEVKQALSRNIDLWLVPLKRSDSAEIMVEKIRVPPSLRWEQPFDADVFVYSNVSTKARVWLYTGEGVIEYPEAVPLQAGQRKKVTFPSLVLKQGGPHEIRAVIEPLNSADDTLSENNQAYAFTDVETDSRILILTSDLTEVQHLLKALEGQKLDVQVRTGSNLPEHAEEYRRYDCIVLANLGREYLSEQQMGVIESCVQDQGAGLVMIGGDQSFGAGGYLNTPIERALPVTMELRNAKIMPSGALGIVLHTCEFADGNSWGKKIAKQAIDVLSPQDYAGVLIYGNQGGESWVFMPTPVARKNWMFNLIDNCNPGDMPDLDRIVSMAVNGIAALPRVSLRHVIVITDGDPSPPSPITIKAAKNAKITITVVVIYPHGGGDIAAMKNLAESTGGRYYHPQNARALPLIFIKEAAIVRKSLIQSDEKGIPVSLASAGEVLREFGDSFPDVRAFVVSEARPASENTELHLYTVVEGEKIPILARRRYGLGKSVAFTSDATSRWAPQWVRWGSYDKFWTNLFHWVSRTRMPTNHTVSTRIEGNTGYVTVEALDEQGQYVSFARLIGTASEPGIGGSDLDATSLPLNFELKAPGKYEASFPVRKHGAYTLTITDQSDPAKPSSIVTGLVNSYSREFSIASEDTSAIDRIAELIGPEKVKSLERMLENPRLAGVFKHDLPPVENPADLFWPLLLAALLLFPFDVAVRRLQLDPQTAWNWLAARLRPLAIFFGSKKAALDRALAEAKSTGPVAPTRPLMPTGSESRSAQGRFESAGNTEEAKNFDLNPQKLSAGPKAVGGSKISPADEAASDYTRALLKAKRRAKKKE